MKLFSFEKLDVWKLGRDLTKGIYLLTRNFPKDEKFGLTSQIKRAVVSITSKIAEGSSRKSGKDQAPFTEISYGSLLEVLNLLIVAFDMDYISEDELNKQRPIIEELSNKLNGFRNYQLNK